MTDTPRYTHPLRFAELAERRPTPILLEPDAAERAAIARALGISGVRKLRLAGQIAPLGARDWVLTAELGATVTQPCVVTLAPVTTRIDEPVTRTFLARPPELPDEEEVEMPGDDSVEPLPEVLDLGAVLVEALALALPAYPRAPGAEAAQTAYTEPGKQPMTEAETKPFAGLASLRDKLAGDSDD